ncbi:hypothetical protein SI859A1_02302 [Aurantimonas manganoxydans SI85-9A1]|uniref:Uncharacterized protein n=1 Tax=Aurantimonas manganoxydans (strain ATCC BAA-1229 / DSM 21871 / SI85-9A1) TaxID=287752 RepID=Q1YM95_AURMS|nr:hypothetical protein SI859A1_02302 [Aurantimonas manganoxydans SI85-9A1]
MPSANRWPDNLVMPDVGVVVTRPIHCARAAAARDDWQGPRPLDHRPGEADRSATQSRRAPHRRGCGGWCRPPGWTPAWRRSAPRPQPACTCHANPPGHLGQTAPRSCPAPLPGATATSRHQCQPAAFMRTDQALRQTGSATDWPG